MSTIVKLYKLSVVLLACFLLSACAVTRELSNNIKQHETGSTFDNSDTLIGISLAQQEKKTSWAIIGTHFDYILESGNPAFFSALVTGDIDKKNLKVVDKVGFDLVDGKSRFTGSIKLKYTYNTEKERSKISALFVDSWRYCKEDYYPTDKSYPTGSCTLNLDNLRGTIHQKATTQPDIFRFEEPVKVSFYTKNSLSAKRALYPVALAADAVILPVYAFIGVVALAVYVPFLLK